MTLVVTGPDRVLADSMAYFGNDLVPNVIGKVRSLPYIPYYEKSPGVDPTTPVKDYLVGMTYTGSANIFEAVYRFLLDDWNLTTIVEAYKLLNHMGLVGGSQNNATIIFFGAKGCYEITAGIYGGGEIVTRDLSTPRSMGSGSDDFGKLLRRVPGITCVNAMYRTFERQAETCGGFIESWRWVKEEEEDGRPALFYRDEIFDSANPRRLRDALLFPDQSPEPTFSISSAALADVKNDFLKYRSDALEREQARQVKLAEASKQEETKTAEQSEVPPTQPAKDISHADARSQGSEANAVLAGKDQHPPGQQPRPAVRKQYRNQRSNRRTDGNERKAV